MTNTYLTGNPLGSSDPKDLFDNASNMDDLISGPLPSYNDRFNVRRQSWSGMEMSFDTEQAAREADFQAWLIASGYEYLDEYTAGLVFTRRSQYMVRADIAYRLLDSTPIPYTTTGNWVDEVVLFSAFSTDSTLRQDLALPSGSTLVGFKDVTVADKLIQFPSVKEYGAVGDGVTDDSAAFIAANNDVAAGLEILVSPGSYQIFNDLSLPGRRFKFLGQVSILGGKLLGAVITRVDPVTGTTMYGSGVPSPGAPHTADYKFGDTLNDIQRRGLTFGGANPDNGTDGTRFSLDSYSGWAVVQNTKPGGPQEFAVQSNAVSGIASCVIGGNVFTSTYPLFSANHVGKLLYFGTGRIYKISVVNSPTSVTVVNQNGSGVSFEASLTEVCLLAYVGGFGSGVISGAVLQRTVGDPFVPMGIQGYFVRFEGDTQIYTVTAQAGASQITLAGASFPANTNVNYEYWTTIDHLTSRLVVQRANGLAGAEEVIALEAYADGKFRLQALSSFGTSPFAASQRPFALGNGYSQGPSGGARTHILLDGGIGDTFIGGGYDNTSSLRVASREGVVGNNAFVSGASTGNPVLITTEGVDANIDLKILPKGNGLVWLGPSISGTVTVDSVIFVKNRAGQTFQIPCKLVP